MSTTVTSKGQVTIPKPIRSLLVVKPGSKVEFKVGKNGEIFIQSADKDSSPPDPDRFSRWKGFLGPSPSTDEIMALLRGDE
jgi:AbrB family looped-hinge helix DNA binding protein